MIRIFPSELKGIVDDRTYKRLLEIYNLIYTLSDRIDSANTNSLTGQQLLAIKAALQASGRTPLNVQGLLGVLAQAQVGGAPSFASLPVPADPRSQDGALGVLTGTPTQLYRYDEVSRSWLSVAATGIVTVLLGAVAKGARAILNFIGGTGITIAIADNPGNARVDITISITGSTGWGAFSGTLSRAAYASYAGQTILGPTIAEVQAIDDALKLLSQTVAALGTDATTQGILKP